MWGSPNVFFLDRDWWAWNGWTAVAAIVGGFAALGALAALIFFWLQFVQVRTQARDQAEQQQKRLDAIQDRLLIARGQSQEVKTIAGAVVMFCGIVCGIVLGAGARIGIESLQARLRPQRKHRLRSRHRR